MMEHTDVLERPVEIGAPGRSAERRGRLIPVRFARARIASGARDARRRSPIAAVGHPRREGAPAQATASPAAATERALSWTIEKIIEQRAVRTVFQPIVHLATRTIVGFEALSRGPEKSEFESPIALLQAAEGAGRLGELDWLCRVSALRAAAASNLPAGLVWFINVEPAGLDTPCPAELAAEFAQASAQVRVMVEFVERGIRTHASALLGAAADVRQNSWGVALDDVGADAGSLAVLPAVQPDVVKLDGGLLRPIDQEAAAHVVTAVRAYAERRGAAIVAEGIETEEDERIARAFGAEFGQGYLFGRPGPLPASVPTPRHVVPMCRRVDSGRRQRRTHRPAAVRRSTIAPGATLQPVT